MESRQIKERANYCHFEDRSWKKKSMIGLVKLRGVWFRAFAVPNESDSAVVRAVSAQIILLSIPRSQTIAFNYPFDKCRGSNRSAPCCRPESRGMKETKRFTTP